MADLSAFPPSWPAHSKRTTFISEFSDPSWCESTAVPPPPASHICALCGNRVCLQSLKQELKDDLEEAFGKPSHQKWRMLSWGLASHVLQNREPLRLRAETWSVSLAVGRRPRAKLGKWRRHPESRFQDKSLHPTLLIFFGRKACLFGGEMNPQY